MTTPQPSRQALSSGQSFSIFTQLDSCTTVCSANEPSRHIEPEVETVEGVMAGRAVADLHPGRERSRVVAQVRMPLDAAHAASTCRHETEDDVVALFEPVDAFARPASTTPAPSCPPIMGGAGVAPARSPVTTCSSEWHIPDAASLTSTSPAFGGSSSISSTLHGVLISRRIAARVLTSIPPKDRGRIAALDCAGCQRHCTHRRCGAPYGAGADSGGERTFWISRRRGCVRRRHHRPVTGEGFATCQRGATKTSMY